jgi:DNA-binding NarL/FixJ family response regulator
VGGQCVTSRRRILFVDNDLLFRECLLQIFESATVGVEWIRTASELRSRTVVGPSVDPTLVFLDWDLPDAIAGEPLGVIQTAFPLSSIVVLSRQLNGDTAALLLARGIPSIQKPIHPLSLSQLALGLSASGPSGQIDRELDPQREVVPAEGTPTRVDGLGNMLDTYALSRRLSRQQRRILDLYLRGKSDKEIAAICQCSEATVYEHWRRMARKAGGGLKSHLIGDFHRYLRE